MARQTKATKPTETEQVAAPVNSVDAAPKEKKVKVAKASKAEAAPVVAESPVATEETAVVTSDEAPLAEQSVEFSAKLQQLGVIISSLKSEFRTLEKKWAREMKAAQKQSSKRKRNCAWWKPRPHVWTTYCAG